MDDGYARRTRWGGIVCPGPYILRVAAIAPGLPGVSWLWGGVDFEWRHPIRIGDIIAQRGRLIDAYEKRGANVPRMLVQVGEFNYTDQLGERVAIATSYTLHVPRSKARGGLSYTPRATHWTDADIAFTRATEADRERAHTYMPFRTAGVIQGTPIRTRKRVSKTRRTGGAGRATWPRP